MVSSLCRYMSRAYYGKEAWVSLDQVTLFDPSIDGFTRRAGRSVVRSRRLAEKIGLEERSAASLCTTSE